ncbi:MAG: pyruvate carboxylase subunit B [Thermodesulfobacteriota bacterium]
MNEETITANPTPLKILDTTLRDGHQSLLATRMKTQDMIPLAERMDEVGYWACEVWGGATFDTMHRFLKEDPWERPRLLKRYIKKTPFSMLLRGQNLVGYRNYSDDVVRAFVDKACAVGIDIFRVFDALNDFRNFETSVEVVKENGRHFQGTICYSLTERRMGGPVFNLEYYLNKAGQLEAMGADSICVKDMAGLIAPYDAFTLISELKKRFKMPIHLHTHYTSGMAAMSYLKAAEAGVDIVDCALAPFALRTSQPAVEPIVAAFIGTPRDTGLNLNLLVELSQKLEEVAVKYRQLLDDTRMAAIDTGVLLHQVPGGMISNLINQLKEQKAVHRLAEVYAEIPKTRRELGSPPLVTPTSQIVGVQAVLNVLLGPYKVVTQETRGIVQGLYGLTPTAIDPEVAEKVLKKGKNGQYEQYDCRPGDVLEPEMEKVKETTSDYAWTEEEQLICALFPATGKLFCGERHRTE